MKQIPILTYHGLTIANEVRKKNRYNISINKFSTQMKWLYQEGYNALTLQELINSDSPLRKLKKMF